MKCQICDKKINDDDICDSCLTLVTSDLNESYQNIENQSEKPTESNQTK